ncbi:TPA: hypothetical protein ACH3X1_011617 [Trebouxia sp. C0004]
MLASIQLPTHADNQRSYVPSKTNYEQAKEAANRMGWTLHIPRCTMCLAVDRYQFLNGQTKRMTADQTACATSIGSSHASSR